MMMQGKKATTTMGAAMKMAQWRSAHDQEVDAQCGRTTTKAAAQTSMIWVG